MLSDLFVRRIALKPGREDSYVFDLPVIRDFQPLELASPVPFLVGENGAGKSPLLEAVALNCGFNAEGGTRNFRFSTQATHSPLHRYLTVAKGVARPRDGFFLRAESFYNVATEVDRLEAEDSGLLRSYGGASLHAQSHGESFMALVEHRFGGQGLYLLDEPEAALSPARQLALLARLHELVQRRSQFLIATHSPILMAYPGADIFVLGEGAPRRTPYEETEHYQLTRSFLENPQRTRRYLCAEEDS